MKTYVHLYLAELFLKCEMFQTKVAKKIKTHIFSQFFTFNYKTHILCSITFFPENRAIYEIMWKNVVEPDSPQITIYYSACAVHVGKLKLQTHAQNM
jgi:hypothetical protein